MLSAKRQYLELWRYGILQFVITQSQHEMQYCPIIVYGCLKINLCMQYSHISKYGSLALT